MRRPQIPWNSNDDKPLTKGEADGQYIPKPTDAADKQILTYNYATRKWEAKDAQGIDKSGYADGQVPVYNAANDDFEPGDGGKIYQPGTGIAITNPDTSTPTISSTLGSIVVDEWVDTYADLPNPPPTGKITWGTLDTDLIYGWNGSAWPPEGSGVTIGSGYRGDWEPRNYGQGAMVTHNDLLLAARVSTSDIPLQTFSAASDVAGAAWTRNSVYGTNGDEVILQNNSTNDTASVVSNLAFGASFPSVCVLEYQIYAGGSADVIDFGVLDGGMASTSVGARGMNDVSGFFGFSLDIYNNRVRFIADGVIDIVAGATPAQEDIYLTAKIKYENEADHILATLFLDDAAVGTWTFSVPSWTSGWKFAVASGSGNAPGLFKVRGTPKYTAIDPDWVLLARAPGLYA